MSDDFEHHARGLESPASHAAVVTPSDSDDLSDAARGLYIGVAGDLKVTTVGGDIVEFRGLQGGSVLPVSVKKVFATGQTGTIASAILALR
jgi:hypothetical protein